jgi:predicted dehydrogenase
MLKIGIIGFGMMGRMHFRCWQNTKNVKVVALCDPDAKRFGQASGSVGNIAGADAPSDLAGIECFSDLGQMLKTVRLDGVSICTPTYLHPQHTIQCLNAGVNVLCEKPMALSSPACRPMIAAAKKAHKRLQVGQCIRFWPQYIKAREIVRSGNYGRVLAATFQRLSATPVWSWKNWLLDPVLSGGAALDLHIHDTDFVHYLFGMPRAVFSRAAQGPFSDGDHIVTQYLFKDRKAVSAEGGWLMAPKFGFQMSFNIVLEKATLVYDSTRDPAFKVCTMKGETQVPGVAPGDGYSREIAHFAAAIAGKKLPVVTTPEQSCASVRIVEAEKKSADTGRVAELK